MANRATPLLSTLLGPCRLFIVVSVISYGLPALFFAQTDEPQKQNDLAEHLVSARKLLAASDYNSAERSLSETVELVPSSGEAHYLLGFALLHERKAEQALTEYMQGAKLRQPGAEEFLGFGSAQALLQQNANAEQSFLTATRLAPERPLPWYLLGRTQFDESHWADAERSFSTCLKLDPHHVRAQTHLGLTQERLNKPEAALASYRTAIVLQEQVADKDPQPYLVLGRLLRKQGKTAESLPFLTIATWSKTPDASAHQELGLAKEQLRQYDGALQELKTAVYLSPDNGMLHFFLGRIYRETGHQGEAEQEFAMAARLLPGSHLN